MLSPHMFSDMPGLVDPNSPFHPPPPGVSQGGQPGTFYDPFPGAPSHQTSAWQPPTFQGTPYPQSAASFPGWTGGGAPPPPNSAPPALGFPFGSSNTTQQQYYTQFNNTPALSWGAQTPAGSYGPPQTPTTITAPPNIPFGRGYAPWSAPAFSADVITPGGFYAAPAVNNYNHPHQLDQNQYANTQPMGWGEPTKEHGGGYNKKGRKRSGSMKRSTSEGPSQQRKKDVQRSNSFGNSASSPFGGGGGGGGVFGYQSWPGYYPPVSPYQVHTDVYGPKNLARRPRDWRADYTPRGGLAAYLPNIVGRSRSDVHEITDNTRRSLHPLLQYTPNRPPIDHDLRSNPMAVSPHSLFLNLNRPHNHIDFAQLATNPPATFMRLYHATLPWYVDVRQSHMNGVTVYDVLAQMYRQLMSPITGRHFWNEDLNAEDRRALTLAFQERCAGEVGEVGRGVVQVDFMGVKVVFEGLVRGKGGMWEMKMSRLDR